MSSPAAESAAFRPLNASTIEEALQTLDDMLSAERAFDAEVVARIEELLMTLPDARASVELVRGLLNVQLLWYQQLLPKRTIPAGLKAVRWSRQLGDRALLGKALTYRAAFAVETEDLSVGFEALVEALQIGKETGDADRIATCYNNLEVIMARVGRYRAALACIESSLEWSDKLTADPANLRAGAMDKLADLQLRQGDWQAALDSARAAQGLFGPAKGDRSHYACSICNEVSALVHLLDFEGASEAIERLSTLSQQHPSAYTDSLLSFAVAELEGFLGNTTLAAKTLRVPGFMPDKEDALRVMIDIYEHAGEPHNALEVTIELLDHLRAAQYQVAEHDIRQINLTSVDAEDGVIRELLGRSAQFEVEARKLGDRFQAKLAYLFELAVSAELREEDVAYAGEHIYRVGRLCAALASEADCDEEMCWLAEIAGRAHDVGKTSLPSHVILKTEQLSAR